MDPVAGPRREAFRRDEPDFLRRFACDRASARHPNPTGAQQFASVQGLASGGERLVSFNPVLEGVVVPVAFDDDRHRSDDPLQLFSPRIRHDRNV